MKKIKKIVKIGRHKTGGRIMLEAQWLAEAGFDVGQLYIVHIADPGVMRLIAVTKAGPTVRKVSGGWTSDRRKSCLVIDLKGVRDVFGEAPTHVNLEIVGGEIVITERKEATA